MNIPFNYLSIDVANWRRDDAAYPEGARDKTLIYSPSSLPQPFLKINHPHLFKRSSKRYDEQFWVEIFAYHLGIQMEISVPPTYVAYDSERNQSGALVEWFLDDSNVLRSGGDYCQQYIPDFDRKKGTQHNFETISKIFEDLHKRYPGLNTQWHNYWAKVFLFDALIGNTDRHQDNWGLIQPRIHLDMKKIAENIRISPVFDNGTSMGCEIFSKNFHLFQSKNYLENYILKGKHHIKWNLDSERVGLFELLQKYIEKYPETHSTMLASLKKIKEETFKNILNSLVLFDIPVKLTAERADFMLKLLTFRYHKIINILEK